MGRFSYYATHQVDEQNLKRKSGVALLRKGNINSSDYRKDEMDTETFWEMYLSKRDRLRSYCDQAQC